MVPSLEEQEKTAEFLGLIDRRIKLLEDAFNLVKQFKKGVCQRMFCA